MSEYVVEHPGGRRELVVELYAPHPKQRELHKSDARFKVLNWGRRTGKSTFAINECFKRAIGDNGRYWIVAPTYKQAKNIYWRDLVNHVPESAIAKKNESELIILLKNGSTIELKGADSPDSLRGAGIRGVVMDEYAFMRPFVYDDIIGPMIRQTKGWAIWISTPDGFNHFFTLVEEAQRDQTGDWVYSHATAFDNPYFPDEEIEAERKKLMERELDDGEIRFKQEYLAEFKKKTGLVYKAFNREAHIVQPDQIPTEGTRLLGIDFGFTNPLAAIFVLVDYDNNWWVYDELYRSGLATEQATTIIKQKMGDNAFAHTIGDSAAAQEIENFKAHGLYVTAVNKSVSYEAPYQTKSSIQAGIRMLQDKLKIQEGSGKPKLFVSKTCSNLIWEFETYSYPEKKDDHNAPEEPIKENDHALDALRYLALSMYAPGEPNYEPVRHQYDPLTGRMLT